MSSHRLRLWKKGKRERDAEGVKCVTHNSILTK